MPKIKTTADKKITRSLCIIWLLTAGTCLFIFRDFLFGGKFVVFKDTASDTIQQYIMQYSTIINHIRDGNFTFWDFSNGFGMNMMGLNIFNPFLMLIYGLGTVLGISRIPALLVYLIILEIFLSGTVMYLYLSEISPDNMSLSETSKCISSYIYAFNGYMLIWGQHYQFGGYVVFLPLLLLFIEKTQKSRKLCPGIPVLVAVMSMCSVYLTYMALLFTGVYLIFRTAMQKKTVKAGRLCLFAKSCGGILLGIGMGMAVFLPDVYYLLNISSRLSQGSALSTFLQYLKPASLKFYVSVFLRLFSSHYQGNAVDFNEVLNYYETPVYFATLLAVILFFQYIFTIHRQKTETKNKILQCLIIAAVLFFYFQPAGTCVFNAFAEQTWRHTFTLMTLTVLMIAFALDRILVQKQLSLIGLLFSAAVLIIAHALSLKELTRRELKITVVLCGILGLMMIVFLIASCRITAKLLKKAVICLLLSCVILNICAEGYWAYNRRDVLSKQDTNYFEALYGEPVSQLLAYLEETDTSFYRIEKDYEAGSYCMDALAQNYDGVSGYNGTQNKYIQQFVEKLWPNFIRMVNAEYSFRQTVHDMGMASLSGVKYIISLLPDLKDAGLTLEKQFDYLYLYRNENTDSIARFYSDTVSESDFEAYSGNLDNEDFLSKALILEDSSDSDVPMKNIARELEEIPLSISDVSYTDSSLFQIPLDSELLKQYRIIYAEFDITPEASACYYFYNDNTDLAKFHANLSAEKTQHIRLSLPCGSEVLHIGAYGPSHSGTIKNIRFTGSRTSADFSSADQVTIEHPAKDSLVTASVNAPEDGYLFLAIPYEDGWTASVDGKDQEILRADYGFSAVAVTEGSHQVVLEFHTPWLIPGCIIAAIFWLLFFIWLWIKKSHIRTRAL